MNQKGAFFDAVKWMGELRTIFMHPDDINFIIKVLKDGDHNYDLERSTRLINMLENGLKQRDKDDGSN